MLVRKILKGSNPDGKYRNSITFADDIRYYPSGINIFKMKGSKLRYVQLDVDYIYHTPNPKEELSTDSNRTYVDLHLYWGSDVYEIEDYYAYRVFCRLHALR